MRKLSYLISLVIAVTFLLPNICHAYDDTTKLNNQKLEEVIKAIAAYNKVDDRAIGEAGRHSEQYKRFELLLKYCTDSQLTILTTDKNAVVRAYAFWALIKRHHPDVTQLVSNMTQPKKTIMIQFGCKVFNLPVKKFITDMIRSEADSNCEDTIIGDNKD